jgi:hypothetical protein
MKSRGLVSALIVCSFFVLCLLVLQYGRATDLRHRLEGTGVREAADLPVSTSSVVDDTADVLIQYSTPYPGSKLFRASLRVRTPVARIAGFDFEIIITPPELADFSTLELYVDSLDTCAAPEDTCWHFFPVRECLIERTPWTQDWSFFEAHGAPQDTARSACDTIWMVGIAFSGTPVYPQANFVPLLDFGLDVSCPPDSTTHRIVRFDFTGHLSDQFGQLVPFRVIPGEMYILRSVPGDANNDSLVDVGDVVFLLNYLYKGGPEPCVMEAADPNADCLVELGDVIHLVNFLYKGGSPLEPGCAH